MNFNFNNPRIRVGSASGQSSASHIGVTRITRRSRGTERRNRRVARSPRPEKTLWRRKALVFLSTVRIRSGNHPRHQGWRLSRWVTVNIHIARSAGEVEALASHWQSLSHNSSRKTLFQSYEWNLLAARAFADREAPYVVSAESDSGHAIIPAALARDGTLVTFLGETLFDYRDVLSEGDADPLVEGWRELESLGKQLWIHGIREGHGERWRAFDPQTFAEAPYVSGMGADEFAQAHTRAGRLVRRLQAKGVTFEQHSGSETSLLRTIYTNKARQLGGTENNLFADQRRIDFMIAAADLGRTEIFTLESEGALIAGLVTLRDASVRRFYTIYYDLAWSHWSPGTALMFEVTRHSLAEGLSCDYMTGRQNHKHRFATGTVRLLRVDASPKQLHSSLGRLAADQAMAA